MGFWGSFGFMAPLRVLFGLEGFGFSGLRAFGALGLGIL